MLVSAVGQCLPPVHLAPMPLGHSTWSPERCSPEITLETSLGGGDIEDSLAQIAGIPPGVSGGALQESREVLLGWE